MKRIQTFARGLVGLLVVLPAIGCESLSTGPETERQSRVLLSSGTTSPALATALLSQEPTLSRGPERGGKRNGPISLADVSKIEVQVTGIMIQTAAAAAESSGDDVEDGDWTDLALKHNPADFVDLKNLETLELATVGQALTGEIEAIRLVFGEARVVFNGSDVAENLFIPSGKVTIPARGVTVNQGDDIVINFLSGATVKKIIRTGRGLLMPPVFKVANSDTDGIGDDSDDAEGDDDADDDSATGDDSSDAAGDDDSTSGDDTTSDGGDTSGDGTTSDGGNTSGDGTTTTSSS